MLILPFLKDGQKERVVSGFLGVFLLKGSETSWDDNPGAILASLPVINNINKKYKEEMILLWEKNRVIRFKRNTKEPQRTNKNPFR